MDSINYLNLFMTAFIMKCSKYIREKEKHLSGQQLYFVKDLYNYQE